MNKLRAILSLSVAVSLGTVFGSCTSFSSGNTGGSGGSSATGSGGDNGTGSGGDTSTGSGGDTSTGSGGDTSTGSGGDTASGGTTGSGGSTASGGTTGSGGTTASGGATGSGGSTASGGTTGSGGAAGKPGSGGAAGSGAAGKAGSGGTTGSGGMPATGGTTGTGGTTVAATPCSILAAAGNTCVAAHSTVRVIYPSYTGPLYQVCKGTSKPGPASCSGTTMDIGSTGGFANAAAQDTFCSGGTCTISIIYDQSPNKNDLKPAPSGGAKNSPDSPASATALKVTLSTHPAYGILITSGIGYRAGCSACGVVTPKGTATGDQAETEYMVTSKNNLIDNCCFDYGNGETDSHDDGNGTMEAVYFGGGVIWGTGSPGGRTGPWVMADLENGLYAGWENGQDQNISTNTPAAFNYVTAVLVGDTQDKNSNKGRFALYAGDATTTTLSLKYDGIRPAKTGYVPMHKQGSIILGIGGDNSDSDGGEWFEGVMASGAATTATLNSLQANIAAAGYGK